MFASRKNGYGLIVIVDHGNNISTRYGHLRGLKRRWCIDQARRTDRFGWPNGRSTGSHLHYEVRLDQVPVNPLAYLPTSTPVEQTNSQAKKCSKQDKWRLLRSQQEVII